jgi:hypothetical protein
MHEPCYSSNPEVIECYCDSYIFLQPIPNSVSRIWYRKNVNVSKGILIVIVASMAAKVGLVGDLTNKSYRSTSISRMIARVVILDVRKRSDVLNGQDR